MAGRRFPSQSLVSPVLSPMSHAASLSSNKMKLIQPSTRLRQSEHILKQEAAGTSGRVNVEDGRYYSLEDVGGRAWDLCDGTRPVAEIADLLAAEFDAPAETILSDLLELLTDMANENLLDGSAPPVGRA